MTIRCTVYKGGDAIPSTESEVQSPNEALRLIQNMITEYPPPDYVVRARGDAEQLAQLRTIAPSLHLSFEGI